MFAIEVEAVFSAAHALRFASGELELLHGHDFRVTLKIAAAELDEMETVVDFHEVEAALEELLSKWRNRNLNEVEPFKTRVNPSAEQIAAEIGRAMGQGVLVHDPEGKRGLRVVEVRVTEAPNCLAIWHS